MRWLVTSLVILSSIGTVMSLTTGTTLNPVRGFGPLLVSRTKEPMFYSFGVYVLAGIAIGFGLVLLTQPIR